MVEKYQIKTEWEKKEKVNKRNLCTNYKCEQKKRNLLFGFSDYI